MSILERARTALNRYMQAEPKSSTAQETVEHFSASTSPSSRKTLRPGQKLLGRLLSNRLNDREIKRLARLGNNKERVLDEIRWLNSSFKGVVIDSALDQSTSLGRFFAVKRGWFPTSSKRGTLAQLKNMQIRLAAWSQRMAREWFTDMLLFLPISLPEISISELSEPKIDIIGLMQQEEKRNTSPSAYLETHQQELPLTLPKVDELQGSYARMGGIMLDRPPLSEPAAVITPYHGQGIEGLSFLKIEKTGTSPSCDTSTISSNNPF